MLSILFMIGRALYAYKFGIWGLVKQIARTAIALILWFSVFYFTNIFWLSNILFLIVFIPWSEIARKLNERNKE